MLCVCAARTIFNYSIESWLLCDGITHFNCAICILINLPKIKFVLICSFKRWNISYNAKMWLVRHQPRRQPPNKISEIMFGLFLSFQKRTMYKPCKDLWLVRQQTKRQPESKVVTLVLQFLNRQNHLMEE